MVGRFVEIVSTNVLLVARRGRFSVYQGDDRIDVFHAAVSFLLFIIDILAEMACISLDPFRTHACPPNMYRVSQGRRMVGE